MFRDILDYQKKNSDYHRVGRKKNTKNIKKSLTMYKPNDNYFGKGNKVIDQYNKNIFEKENDENFQKTKNKIKLVVFKNGFILNNGPFRDRSLIENNEFLESVEKGNIPQELINKGILDLGILLINRKTEIFSNCPLYRSLPMSLNYLNISPKKNTIQRPIHVLDQFFMEQAKNQSCLTSRDQSGLTSTYEPPATARLSTPVNNLNIERVMNKNKYIRKSKKKKTVPLDNFIKVIDIIEGKKKKKTYIAFSGKGQLMADASIEIKNENDIKSFLDNSSPSCIISIRLFNGEIIKGKFNYNQTLKDIYYCTKKLSGLNDFALLDGFPPKPLLDLDKTIRELKIENSVLTQKLG